MLILNRKVCFVGVVTSIMLLCVSSASAETPLERGTYLMKSIAACGNCHTTIGRDGKPVAGMEMAGNKDFFTIPEMTIHVPNITPDPETGIGNWTDEQIIAAIREGKHADGYVMGPFMPFEMYRQISDSDVKAMVTYLRQVPPVHNELPRSVFNVPIPPGYGPAVVSVEDVSRDDQVAYGQYLAGPLGHCIECHTPMNSEGGGFDFANRLGAGGNFFPGPWGTSVAPNLTPTGLQSRSDEEIKTIITTGIRPDGSSMLPPMGYAYYSHISDSDLDAIVAYLRTLPSK